MGFGRSAASMPICHAQLLLSLLRKRMYSRYGTLILRVNYIMLINCFEITSKTRRTCKTNRRPRLCLSSVCFKDYSEKKKKNDKIVSQYLLSTSSFLFYLQSSFRNQYLERKKRYYLDATCFFFFS